MLAIDKLETGEQHRIRVACAYLFSPQQARDDGFVKHLSLNSLKGAFREKAKMYHPDLHHHESVAMINKRRERFIRIKGAYEIMKGHIDEKSQVLSPEGVRRPMVIAVGGSKGGVGKSVFVANLGVLLSSRGYRTVVMDLDLGGANLHLYLGETSLKWNINDYLSKKAVNLQEIMIESSYGPQLIGGDSSQLGSANISFSRKIKLLKAIRQIDADFIITDLGGDTTYNIIDFFLSADHGVVMMTADPAAYLDAYSFIKTALYRKLNRLFGPESKYRAFKDKDLENLIREATMPESGSRVRTIEELKERVRRHQPQNLPLIHEAISAFKPCLVVNRVANDNDGLLAVKRIQKVAARMLSINVGHLGNLPYQKEIELSTRQLVPIASKFGPGNIVRDRLSRMVDEHFLDGS